MLYPEVESHVLEFKSSIPKNDQILKTVIGFCNQAGGKLLIGVNDLREIIGLEEDEAIQLVEWIEKAVYDATSPPIIPRALIQRIGDKLLVVIEVNSGMNKPYHRTSEGLEKGTYIRIGTSTTRASLEMIEELKWQSRGLSYDSMPLYQSSEDELDKKKILSFLQSRKHPGSATPTDDTLFNYNLIKEEHFRRYPTNAGILLFGKRVDHWFSEAMTICTHFSGTSGREAIATRDCIGTLFEQFENAYEFILGRLNRSFTIKGPRREEKFELPVIAIRELLLNALIHRNYHHKAPTKVAIYEDRIEIFSPGGFPTPFPNLRLGLTDVRNIAICKVFREANYIEKLGSGFVTVFDSYVEWKLPEPKIINGDVYVKCILPREKFQEEFVSDPNQQILDLFATADNLSVSEVMSQLKIPRATATRRLKALVEEGKLIQVGKGKGTKYCLK